MYHRKQEKEKLDREYGQLIVRGYYFVERLKGEM